MLWVCMDAKELVRDAEVAPVLLRRNVEFTERERTARVLTENQSLLKRINVKLERWGSGVEWVGQCP